MYYHYFERGGVRAKLTLIDNGERDCILRESSARQRAPNGIINTIADLAPLAAKIAPIIKHDPRAIRTYRSFDKRGRTIRIRGATRRIILTWTLQDSGSVIIITSSVSKLEKELQRIVPKGALFHGSGNCLRLLRAGSRLEMGWLFLHSRPPLSRDMSHYGELPSPVP
ncbi:hypothetical protein O1611_g5268 [Lasiodiplodia mahajangana]|uniref:Uncharacterized protein n=1 Tax=Lasiodiplodia mahajangana TaxID=1108764 RepID=A0ACC2JM86_9PEZI|nr:hypothetical protein O1611_g5268 [Lasiodiplodia mahajangana]